MESSTTVVVALAAASGAARETLEAALDHPAIEYEADADAREASLLVVLSPHPLDGAARTVVVSDSGRDQEALEVRRALRAGAAGYVRLAEVDVALVPSILAVAAGQSAIPAERREDALPPSLTGRERQVLSLVVMGLPNADIADRLYVAESTVKSHLTSAFAKLGVSSRNEAATRILDPRTGLGMGILTIPRDDDS